MSIDELALGLPPFSYAVGEEVVVRLAGAEAFDLASGALVPKACMPPWTVGDVLGYLRREGRAAYVIGFRHYGARCLCVAAESEIDGTA